MTLLTTPVTAAPEESVPVTCFPIIPVAVRVFSSDTIFDWLEERAVRLSTCVN